MRARLLPCVALASLSCGVTIVGPVAGADARFVRFGDRSLERGDHGRDVRVLQRWMTRVGVETGVDGFFGRETKHSVRRYERQFAMKVDGRVSRAQARGLRERVESLAAAAPAAVATAASEPAVLAPDGRTAVVPASAPAPIALAIAAANALTDKPYRYGGGHGSFEDSAYDCSGAVSYVLHAAGLLEGPLDSTGLMGYGAAGPGAWITIYAHGDHAYMTIAGLRFDTSGRGEEGPRWRSERGARHGYAVRHPSSL